MSGPWDVVVVGAGHNGLVAATMLARRGRKVVVVERRDAVGGLAAGEEFAPGYRTAGVLHDSSAVRPWVVEALELEHHGLAWRGEELPVFVPSEAGHGYLHWRDSERGAEELAELSAADAASYRQLRGFLARLRPVVEKIVDEPPADLETLGIGDIWALGRRAVSLRLLGKRDLMEVLRIGPMCAGDWLREWFESEIVRAAMAGEAVAHGHIGPWSPGGTLNILLGESMAGPGVAGGPAALVTALAKAAAAAGVEIRTGCEVESLHLVGGCAAGVVLAGGEVVEARAVAASCDPKTLFLDLVPSHMLDAGFEREVMLYRTRGVVAKIDLALSGYPELACRPDLRVARIRTGESLERLERAADAAKYRQMSERPVLDVYVPTVERPELAPDGHHVVSILASWVPHELDAGWSDEGRGELSARVLGELERVAPGIRELVVAERVMTPRDLEAAYGIAGGHLHHGEHAPDQLLTRPTPACARYRTPFPGLFLCGGGSHPGGGITGAPGALASRAILE